MDFCSKLPASHGRYDKLTDTIMFLYFKKKTITCSLCTPEDENGKDVVNKDE